MAVKGLSTFVHGTLNETNNTYGVVKATSGAIEAKPKITFNDEKVYSDNRLKYQDSSFKEGSITLTIDFADKAILSPLLGRKTEAVSFTPSGSSTAITSTKHISNSTDKPIYVGFGYIVNDFDVSNNKDIYTVKFLYKVQFQPDTVDVKTKEGATKFAYSTLEGTIFELANGNYCEDTDFETEADAVAYLKSLFGTPAA